MDSSRSALENSDLDKLNDKDKLELRQFLANEQQRSQIQSQAEQAGDSSARHDSGRAAQLGDDADS
ncbi:tim10/DDP family zinc finger [Colletotrichum tofieldiae]|nr:Tim10/DDP family zinc finger [Colletotrichum tofieldiae]GKT73280.1 tim10/DDP family zinc finger [Colletotrichum tofieldiae]GKT88046.1 tim10/DDP family zinc finger [Colletotrichum tofieldiae]